MKKPMKNIDTRNRPRSAKKLELSRETLRRLEAPELAGARGGASPSIPITVTRDEI